MANLKVVLVGSGLLFLACTWFMHRRLTGSSSSGMPAQQAGAGDWGHASLHAELAKIEQLEQAAGEHVAAVHGTSSRTKQVLKLALELRRIRGGKAIGELDAAGVLRRNFTQRPHGPLRAWPGVARDALGSGATQDPETERRREAVRDAMRHAWKGYVEYAWGHDELAPLSKAGKDTFGGLGATIADAMDTLWLMEMTEEYERAAEWAREELGPFDKPYEASVFETTIRVVGGLLSAYDLTGDEALARRCMQLTDRLLYAFDTETGIPLNTLGLDTLVASNPAWTKGASTLSEYGTEQLEFVRLSLVSGDPLYAEKAERSIQLLHEKHPGKGLMPLFIDPTTGAFTKDQVSLGALGDSYYEYLLKTWLLKGKADEMYRDMWEAAMDEMGAKLVHMTPDGEYTYVAELNRGRVRHKMDHLVCFVPGMLALGAHYGAVQGDKATSYLELAGRLAKTCWLMYERMPTGLAPEYVQFVRGKMFPGAKHNLLRPEAVESFFVLWRVTGDEKYREWGWAVFQAFEKHCKREAGYSGIRDVRKVPPVPDDQMQSFWLAETLKYLWLLFSPPDVLPLDAWVLNTEAHPLRIVPPAAA